MGELTLDIGLHIGLGVVLFVVVWGFGAVLLSAALARRPEGGELVEAYPVGLLTVSAIAAVYLLDRRIGLALVVLVVAGLVALRRRTHLELGRLAGIGARSLPGAAAFGLVFGLLLHGPTAQLDSRLYGDLLFYVNKVVSGSISLVPFRDLLAEGQTIIYVEGGPSFVGSALEGLPHFDPILFHTTTLTTFLALSFALGFRLVVRRWTLEAAGVATLLSVAATAYPTFIAESPPMAMALPLAFPTYRLWVGELPLERFSALAALTAAGFFWTKVLGAVALAALVSLVLVRRYGHLLRRRRAQVWLTALLGVAAVALVGGLFVTADWYADLVRTRFFPEEALRGALDQLDRRDTQAFAPAAIFLGQVLLLAALLSRPTRELAATLAVSLAAAWFVGGYGFDVAIGVCFLVAAAAYAEKPPLLASRRPLVWAAAATLVASAWFRDILGTQTALVAGVLLAAAVFAALAPDLRDAAIAAGFLGPACILALAGRPFFGALVLAGGTAAFLSRRAAIATAGLALVAATGAAANAGSLELGTQQTTLTTHDYVLWQEVRERVPEEALVFTSMTGLRREDSRQGWNNYPAIGRRQLFLAGWIDGRLVSRPDELKRRLSQNERVLRGQLAPDQLQLDERFSSYFAVMRSGEDVPDSFSRVYSNARFVLYRIAPSP